MLEVGAAIVREWCRIVNGNVAAQCVVNVDPTNAGQLAKYVTKLWELPPGKSRELFAALASRRIVEGFGTWRRWRGLGDVEATPSGWFTSSLTIADIEKLAPDDVVTFGRYMRAATVEPVYRSCAKEKHNPSHTPFGVVLVRSAADVLASLRNDPTPVWEREPQQGRAVDAALSLLRMKTKRARSESLARWRPPPWRAVGL